MKAANNTATLENFKHYLPREITAPEDGKRVKVLVVGAGGNGGPTITGLAQINYSLRALGNGHPGLAVSVMDDDIVGAENVGRQKYYESDISRSKAECIVTRVNMCYRTRWKAEPVRFDKDHIEVLQKAMPQIVISCVDNVPTRKLLAKAIKGRPIYFLDMGNTKDSGQVILGTGGYITQPPNSGDCIGHLPTVLELFPNLQKEEKKSYQGPSCSVAEALRRQNLFTNMAVSTHALQLLWEGFTQGYLTEHGVFVNLATKRTNPLLISPEVWRRMGWNPLKKLPKAA